jgi:hypothetical protein
MSTVPSKKDSQNSDTAMQRYCTGNSKQIFLEMKLCGRVPHPYIRVSVWSIYIFSGSVIFRYDEWGNRERGRAVSFLGIHKTDLFWSACVTYWLSFLQTDLKSAPKYCKQFKKKFRCPQYTVKENSDNVLWHSPFNVLPFLQTDTLPEENRSGDGNSSTRKKVAQFLSQLNCTLLQEGAEAKLAKNLFRKKPKIDFSIFTKTVRYRDKFRFFFFSKSVLFFPVGCLRNPDPVRDRNHLAESNSVSRAFRSESETRSLSDRKICTFCCKFYPFKGLCHVMNNFFEGLETQKSTFCICAHSF